MGGHFNKLFDWKFDKVRVTRDRAFRKNKNHSKIVDKELFEYELFGTKSEILDLVIPPSTSTYSREIYNILTQHVVLIGNGMGVSFRESRSDLSTLLKQYGIDYEIIKPFIDDLEYRLMNQYSEETSKK